MFIGTQIICKHYIVSRLQVGITSKVLHNILMYIIIIVLLYEFLLKI